MNNIETMTLALEALETVTKEMLTLRDELAERGGRPQANEFHQRLWDSSHKAYVETAIPTAEALRQAIEQAQQAEPVAIKTMCKIGKAVNYWRAGLIPPHIGPDSHDITFLYAMPPQRQPLSRKEVLAIIDKHPAEKKTGLPMFYRDQVLDICRAIEAAHGIKGEV